MAGWPSTINGMADKILRTVNSYYNHEFATVAEPIDISETVLDMTAGHAAAMNLVIGDVLEFDAELVLIEAVATDALTVSRAWQGTTAATHASGAMARLHPRIGRQDIYDAIESIILSWEDLFTVENYPCNAEFASTTGRAVEILGAPSEFKRAVKMRWQNDGGVWVPPPTGWDMQRDILSVGSGVVLQWPEPLYQSNSGTQAVTVWLAEPFETGTFEPTTDLIDEIGLTRSMLDVAYFGAMYMLLLPEETQRATIDSSPNPRDAQEVPPGYLAQTALSFRALHDQRYGVEAARLAKRWADG